MTLGEKIKKLRVDNDMTQHQLARHLGVSSSAVGNWEQDLNKPNIDLVANMCYTFDVSPNYFFDLKPQKEKASTPEESEIEASTQGRKFTPREIEVYNILEETFVRLGLIEPGGDLTTEQADAMIALIKIIKLAFNPGNKKID